MGATFDLTLFQENDGNEVMMTMINAEYTLARHVKELLQQSEDLSETMQNTLISREQKMNSWLEWRK